MIAIAPDPAHLAREIEDAARAGQWELAYLSPCKTSVRPWLHRAGPQPGSPRIYLSAGMHGDEIAGPLAALEMLRQPDFFSACDVTIFPLLNPDGIANGTRTNTAGLDLNRDYRSKKSSEIRGHIEVVDQLAPFAAGMFLHEDFEATGAYLYELNEGPLPPALGLRIINAMGRHVPIDLRSEIEEVFAKGGVLCRNNLIATFGPVEEREEWPEAIYLTRRHTRVSYTTETPMLQPLPDRIAAQIAAVSTLMAAVIAADQVDPYGADL